MEGWICEYLMDLITLPEQLKKAEAERFCSKFFCLLVTWRDREKRG